VKGYGIEVKKALTVFWIQAL